MNRINEIALRVAAAYEALSSIDDCARMDIGVDAMGPRNVLEKFIADVEGLAELSKDAKPLGTAGQLMDDYVLAKSGLPEDTLLFTRPANTAEIEQRVAEAIAKMINTADTYEAAFLADKVTVGKWREHL